MNLQLHHQQRFTCKNRGVTLNFTVNNNVISRNRFVFNQSRIANSLAGIVVRIPQNSRIITARQRILLSKICPTINRKKFEME